MWKFIRRLFDSSSALSSKTTEKRCRPVLEALEDRFVPSTVPIDLTTAGAHGSVGGVIFQQGDVQPSGSGVIDSFVRIHALGGGGQEQGYNTSARPLQFNENSSPTF